MVIDPVEFGKLTNAVENLNTQMGLIQTQIKAMNDQLTGGRGVITGLIIAASGVGAGMSHLLDKITK